MLHMKKYIYNLAACLILLTTMACKDFLEIAPSTELGEQAAIRNLDEANGALLGIYSGFITRFYYGREYIAYGDFRGEDIAARNTSARDYSQYTFGHAQALTSTNGGSFWQYLYICHNRANNLLAKIDENIIPISTDLEKATIDNIKGEALALRALLRFDLVRIYGEPYLKNKNAWGVAIPNKVVKATEKEQRSTVEETFRAIVDDLTSALNVISEKKATPGRLNKWSVNALLARVYLYMGDYENAYLKAKDVIENGGYKLIENVNYVASWSQDFTTESIFEVAVSQTENADRESIGYAWSPSGYNSAVITNDLHNLLKEDEDDIRLNLLKPNPTTTYTVAKYPGRDGNVYVNNARVLRLSDIYLIAAEAGVNRGKADASDYLNAIRKRANPAATDVTATLDLVEKERRKELFGEGHRFFDIIRKLGNGEVKRTGLPSSAPIVRDDQVPVISWTNAQSHLLILPIPQSEIDSNPDIHQNAGYGSSK